jgi:hypothetical protein
MALLEERRPENVLVHHTEIGGVVVDMTPFETAQHLVEQGVADVVHENNFSSTIKTRYGMTLAEAIAAADVLRATRGIPLEVRWR